MRSIPKIALAFLVAGTASCVAYAAGNDQFPPGSPPSYGGYPGDRYGDRHSPDWEVGFFYQELSPFGDWIYTYEYGWSWLPRNVRFGWRPYYYGRWVPSEYGWFWVSDEPFGWATYHFGRWALHPRFGWIWLPGRTWGPAWVAWQYGNGWVGWAPLPPEVGFEFGIGLRLGGFDLSFGIGPQAYIFVEERVFLEREPYRYAVPPARNVTIIQNTTNITHYTVIDNRVINRGVEVHRLERATGRRVQQFRVTESQTDKNERIHGEEVRIYKPTQTRLESVKVDESRPGRGRPTAERSAPERREPERSAPQRREPAARTERPEAARQSEVEVAPHVKAGPPVSDERLQRKESKERADFEAYERGERQRLENAQRQEREREKSPPAGKAEATAKRQAAERQALEQEMKRSKQQLAGRQEVERQAAKTKAAGKATGKAKAAEKPGKDEKGAEKGKKKAQEEKPPRRH